MATSATHNSDDETSESFHDTVDNKTVMRVMVKVPPFWAASPDIWFAQIEAQFVNAGITQDSTKYFTVVGAIDASILAQVSEIILNPPNENKYRALKEQMLKTFSDSEQKKLTKLLSEISLGDRKPTQLLNEMKKLAGDKVGDEMLRTLFLKCLPSQVTIVLSTNNKLSLIELAEMADKMIEMSEMSNVNATSSTGSSRIQELEKKIDSLTKTIGSLSFKRRSRNYSRSRSRSRSRSGKKPSSENGEGKQKHPLCWYHFNYGDKASKCVSPCNFQQKN